MDWSFIIISLIKIILITFVILLPMIAYSVYAERRFAAIIQDRVGPNRVGIPLTLFGGKKDLKFYGLLQPLADGLKFLLKEDFTPNHVRKTFFWMAPVLTMVPALVTVAVIPFSSPFTLASGKTVSSSIANLNIGPIFIFAIASLSVYGIALAGWASNSKFPYIGGIRSAAQMISYEICLGLSVIPVFLVFGELNLSKIVSHQAENGWLLLPLWGEGLSLLSWLLLIPLSLSFLIFTISIFAETNRMPFDLPECETELVGGYHTEYSSMKFALFFLGEYAAMIIGSSLIVTLFFGGWSLPFGWSTFEWMQSGGFLPTLIHFFSFLIKIIGFILFFIWVRWSIPRFRYDQLMRLGWIVFFEAALGIVVLTALILTLFS